MTRGYMPAAIATACLLALAPPARAQQEPLRLACEPGEKRNDSYYPLPVRVVVDLAGRIVTLQATGGGVMTSTTDKRSATRPPTVRFSDAAFVWDLSTTRGGTVFKGTIDRETGNADMFFTDGSGRSYFFEGRCRLVGQKF